MRQMKNTFYVSVEFKHSFSFESTPSKLSSDIIRSIVAEIKYKIDNIVLLFDWAGSIFSFFFLYVIVKWVLIFCFTFYHSFKQIRITLYLTKYIRVLKYRQKYLTIDSFDNTYLTWELYELDERKQILGLPTVLPLTRIEKNKYIEVWIL